MLSRQARLTVAFAVIAAISLAPIGCGGKSQFTPEDFKKISKGMTEEQVKDILGNPTETMEAANVKRLFWQVGDKYYSISFVEGKVQAPLGPTNKADQEAMKSLMKFAQKLPKPPTTPPSKKPEEPATTKDGRWIISVSREWLTVKGASFEIGKISKSDLEQLIGPADHDGKALPNSRFLFWDKQGLRAEYSTHHGKVLDFTCYLKIDVDNNDPNPLMRQPKKAFDGIFKVEGVEITKKNTQRMLENSGRLKQPIRHNKLSEPPSFIVDLPNQEIHFDVDEDSKILTEITVFTTNIFG